MKTTTHHELFAAATTINGNIARVDCYDADKVTVQISTRAQAKMKPGLIFWQDADGEEHSVALPRIPYMSHLLAGYALALGAYIR